MLRFSSSRAGPRVGTLGRFIIFCPGHANNSLCLHTNILWTRSGPVNCFWEHMPKLEIIFREVLCVETWVYCHHISNCSDYITVPWAAAWLARLLVHFFLRVIQSELLVWGTWKSYTDPSWMSTVDIVIFVFIVGLKIIFLHRKQTFFWQRTTTIIMFWFGLQV